MRERPFRFRLRAPQAALDQTADPQTGAQVRRLSMDPGQLARRVSRSDLGRSALTWPGHAERIRDHHGPRRMLDLARPFGRTKRRTCSRNWCAPVSDRTTSTTARACATRLRLLRCSRAWAPAQFRIKSRTWRKRKSSFSSARIPPRTTRRSHVDQERRQARRKLIVADPRRNDLLPPCVALSAIQTGHGRGDVERDDSYHHRRRPCRWEVHQRTHSNNHDALKETPRTFAGKMAPLCGIPAETLREVARVCRQQRQHDPLGHGHFAACARHRQRTLPHCAHLDDGAGRQTRRGLHPLRGQNNVQGASRGPIPMMFPNYRRVDNRTTTCVSQNSGALIHQSSTTSLASP